MRGPHNGFGLRLGVYVRHNDPLSTHIQRPKHFTGMVTAHAHNRRQAKTLASADMMFPFQSVACTMLSIDKSKIKARRSTHFHQRWSRRFDDQPVEGITPKKPAT
jgi:hypothetical protein